MATKGSVKIKFIVSCALTLCSLVDGYQHWEHNAPSSGWMDGWVDGCSMFLQNAGTHVTTLHGVKIEDHILNPYPTAFPYGNGMVLHFYQQQESSTTKTVHKVINRGLKAYV